MTFKAFIDYIIHVLFLSVPNNVNGGVAGVLKEDFPEQWDGWDSLSAYQLLFIPVFLFYFFNILRRQCN